MLNTTKGYKMSYSMKNQNQDELRRKSLGSKFQKKKRIKNTSGTKNEESKNEILFSR